MSTRLFMVMVEMDDSVIPGNACESMIDEVRKVSNDWASVEPAIRKVKVIES